MFGGPARSPDRRLAPDGPRAPACPNRGLLQDPMHNTLRELLAMTTLLSTTALAATTELTSPDGLVTLRFDIDNGRPQYRVAALLVTKNRPAFRRLAHRRASH